jgi:hypothetical protein
MTRGIAFVLIALAGCGPSTGRGNPPGNNGATLMSIELQPADATIAIDNGAGNAPVAYTAIGHFSDGKMQQLADAIFALDDVGNRLGALAGAQFSANGGAAGTGHVIATSQGMSGMTGVTVTVHTITLGPGVPPDAPGKLPPTATPGALSPQIVYPLDGALMPASVGSPDVQWEGTAQAGDLFHVKLVAGGATVESIVANGSGFTWDYTPSATEWALLTASAGTSPISVTIDHWDANSGLQGSNPVKVNLAEPDRRDQSLRRLPHRQPRRALSRRRAVGRRLVGRRVRSRQSDGGHRQSRADDGAGQHVQLAVLDVQPRRVAAHHQ